MSRYLNLGDRFGADPAPGMHIGRIPQDNLTLPREDIERLRELAKRKHDIAAMPLMDIRRRLWRDANDLKMTVPPIYINEICWNEIQDDSLSLRCTHAFARELEEILLQELYCFNHDLGDVIVEDYVENPLVVYDSGFGIDEVVDVASTQYNSEIVSRHFHVLINDMNDVEKIKEPEIIVDRERTAQYGELMQELFDGIIDVKTVGARGLWFTPWDYLIRVMGVEQTLMNLILEPEFVEAVVKRYVHCSMVRMQRYREEGIWASNNTAVRVGSGGYGHVSCLDEPEKHLLHCPTKQMWGCGNAQIFSSVSPDMHWQFSLQYEMEWLKQFGITYYGCCEPLSGKMEIMEKIPNLRKISMSPWNDLNRAAERCRGKYVMSCKPSPAVFAMDKFDENEAKKDIMKILEATNGCSIELIMKDISTLHFRPQLLWKWAALARECIAEFYG